MEEEDASGCRPEAGPSFVRENEGWGACRNGSNVGAGGRGEREGEAEAVARASAASILASKGSTGFDCPSTDLDCPSTDLDGPKEGRGEEERVEEDERQREKVTDLVGVVLRTTGRG